MHMYVWCGWLFFPGITASGSKHIRYNEHIHTTSRGGFHPKVGFFWYTGLTFWFNYNARYPRDKKNSSKLLRIEMENYPIIMRMGMYWIEPPWISICSIHTYKTKYGYLYSKQGQKVSVEFSHLGKILWQYIWVAGRFRIARKRCIRQDD